MEEQSHNVPVHESIWSRVKDLGHVIFTRRVIKPILYGQGLSILLCGTAITSTYLAEDYNANVPLTQSLFNYLILALVYGTILTVRKDSDGHRMLPQVLKEHGWKYFLITIADVAANYLIIKAYQYTSLTSVQVLDCFVIPIVMVLSWFILKVRYKVVHYVGVMIALLGVAFMIIADVILGRAEQGSQPLLGDFLVLGAASCYGISNVGMEFVVKHRPVGNMEILSMYGIFGTVITGVLMACLEREALVAVEWSAQAGLLFFGFTACMFLLYSLMPLAMRLSSATTVNISILTADLYALFAGLLLFGYQFSSLYIISFITITFALIIYNSKPPRELNEALANESCGEENEGNDIKSDSDTHLIYKNEEIIGTSFKSTETALNDVHMDCTDDKAVLN